MSVVDIISSLKHFSECEGFQHLFKKSSGSDKPAGVPGIPRTYVGRCHPNVLVYPFQVLAFWKDGGSARTSTIICPSSDPLHEILIVLIVCRCVPLNITMAFVKPNVVRAVDHR
jgi:hypothetical protein